MFINVKLIAIRVIVGVRSHFLSCVFFPVFVRESGKRSVFYFILCYVTVAQLVGLISVSLVYYFGSAHPDTCYWVFVNK